MIKYFLKTVLLITSLFLASCDKENETNGKRSFYMGFTTWPYDFTNEAKQYTYDKINEYGDLIAFHFDNGIPWNEALANTNYPQNILNDLSEKKSKILAGHKVYVSIASLRSPRTKLALYRNVSENQPLPTPWYNANFNDSIVVIAYINYCSLLIDSLKPTYFNYGIESNSHEWNASDFSKYRFFCSKIYSALKNKYPNLELMLSVIVNANEASFSNATELMLYSDYVAISLYPYNYIGSLSYGDSNPDNFPANWLSKMKSIAPNKKFGITETGHIAEDLDLSKYGITKQGTEEWQAKFVNKLLTECNDLKAEFVIYWQIRDYDLGWIYLQSIGLNDQAFASWKDIGLIDGIGVPRKSLNIWKDWLNKKHI